MQSLFPCDAVMVDIGLICALVVLAVGACFASQSTVPRKWWSALWISSHFSDIEIPSFETFLQVRFDPESVFGLSLEMLPLPRLPGDSSLCTAKQ